MIGHAKKLIPLICVAALLLCACSAVGCSLSTEPAASPQPSSTPYVSPKPAATAAKPQYPPAWGHTDALMLLDRGVLANGDCYAVYPIFFGARHQKLNSSIKNAFSRYASTLTNCRIDFCVIYNNNGLLALWAVAHKSGSDVEFSRKPFCFNVWTGMQMSIFDCFLGDSTVIAQTVPDLITEYAKKAGLTLIGYIPPLDDGQEFYFDDESLVFCYQPYEVAAHGDGAPAIAVPLSRIRPLLSGSAPLWRIFTDIMRETS